MKGPTKRTTHVTQALVGAILAVGVGATAIETAAAADAPAMEKCSGIVKKGMNECATASHSCQGQSIKDNASDEWIFVPTGTCSKIVGGIVK